MAWLSLPRLSFANRGRSTELVAAAFFSIAGCALLGGFSACAQSVAPPNGVVSASAQTGADACSKINRSWGTLPGTGGVVDARELLGMQLCGSNPFDGVSKAGLTMIGGATFQTSTAWVLPDKSIVRGIGRGDAGANNSVIQATSSLHGPVIQLAQSSQAFEGVRVEDLTVDCNGNANATGVLDNAAQEQSGLNHVMILNCPNIGLDVEDGSQNASFNELEVMAPGSTSTMRPVVINSGGPVRGIHGVTVNVWSAPYPNVAMTIGTQGSYTDMHCEGAVTCYYVTANNVTLMDVHCGPRVTTCISVAPGVQNLTIMGAYDSVAASTLLSDQSRTPASILSASDEGSGLGWYSIGNGNPSSVCSSSVHIVCTFRMTAAVQPRFLFPPKK